MTKDPEEIKHWLKNRNKINLRCTSNAKNRSICFIDLSNSNYIIIDFSIFKNKKSLQTLYKKLTHTSNNDGEMLNRWMSLIGRRK